MGKKAQWHRFCFVCTSVDQNYWKHLSTETLNLTILFLWQNCLNKHVCVCSAAQLCLTLCNPMDCSPLGSSVHGDSPGKNTEIGCHALLQGIFPTQRPSPGLPHCWQILYSLSHQGSLLTNIQLNKRAHTHYMHFTHTQTHMYIQRHLMQL